MIRDQHRGTGSDQRSDEEWVRMLQAQGTEHEIAVAQLRTLLVRGLGRALAGRQNVDPAQIEDFVQEALLRILERLETFRGESRFLSWAQTVAVRTAFSELRRARWRDVSLDEMVQDTQYVPQALVDRAAPPDKQTLQHAVLERVHHIINEELTERQREGLIAEIVRGVPQQEIAQRMGITANAFYKLVYDARQRLRQGLIASGLSPDDIRYAFDL